MSRISSLNQRYAASAALTRTGVQIVAVGDPAGARFNVAIRRLISASRDDDPGIWSDLVGASKALRWRVITRPQPLEFNPGLRNLADEVGRQSRHLRDAVAERALLDELEASAAGVANADPVCGAALLRDCLEGGAETSLVIAANKTAQAELEQWLKKYGVRVQTVGELDLDQPARDQAYVVGPPKFFRSSLVTAPVTSGVTFLLPAWFRDRSVPRSAIAAYAAGAIRVKATVFFEGDTTEPAQNISVEDDDDFYLPQPTWGAHQPDEREPTGDEVVARKLLLSGNMAMWLDDGERIRSFDPLQPDGERVAYTEVAGIREGTYLLLRKGVTERGVLYRKALANLGQRGEAIDATQKLWKQRLGRRIQTLGYRKVVRDLQSAGIKAADRARAWTDPYLIRPHNDKDFKRLLDWLSLPIEPSFGHAGWLRKTLYQVSTEIGKQLEAAISTADLSLLEAKGNLSLDVKNEGLRGILVTRVLAISPHSVIVSRHDARMPFEDRSGQWLE